MLLFVVVVLSSELRFPSLQGDSLANSPRSKHGDTNPKAVRLVFTLRMLPSLEQKNIRLSH